MEVISTEADSPVSVDNVSSAEIIDSPFILQSQTVTPWWCRVFFVAGKLTSHTPAWTLPISEPVRVRVIVRFAIIPCQGWLSATQKP